MELLLKAEGDIPFGLPKELQKTTFDLQKTLFKNGKWRTI
jgi:hypothetical protein